MHTWLCQYLGFSSFNTHLGTQAEEYTVVLIQPVYVEDLNASWNTIFAVCRRHPNCINVCNLTSIIILYQSTGNIHYMYTGFAGEASGS